jgi:hypothetical protein
MINEFPTSSKFDQNYSLFFPDEYMANAEIERDQLIEICSILENDFDMGHHIKMLGYAKAMDIVKNFGYFDNWFNMYVKEPDAARIKGLKNPVISKEFNIDGPRRQFIFFSYFPHEPDYMKMFQKKPMRATAVISYLQTIGCGGYAKYVKEYYKLVHRKEYEIEDEMDKDSKCDELYSEQIPAIPTLTEEENELWDKLLKEYKKRMSVHNGKKPAIEIPAPKKSRKQKEKIFDPSILEKDDDDDKPKKRVYKKKKEIAPTPKNSVESDDDIEPPPQKLFVIDNEDFGDFFSTQKVQKRPSLEKKMMSSPKKQKPEKREEENTLEPDDDDLFIDDDLPPPKMTPLKTAKKSKNAVQMIEDSF